MTYTTATTSDKNSRSEMKKRELFENSELGSELKTNSIKGGAFMISAKMGGYFVQLIAVMILARLLTPADFGLIAMVTAITGFLMLFSDFGLANATVQQQDINHQQISTLFWINALIGLIVMVAVILMAPVVAWFYDEPRVLMPTVVLSVGFLFGGLMIQHHALLQRRLKFAAIAWIEVIAYSAGALAGIVSALMGLGIWSLVNMQLANTIFRTLGVWVICPWKPGKPIKAPGVKKMLGFGGNLTGFNMVSYFSRNLDNVLIGWYWGPGALGLYSRAYALLLFPIKQMTWPLSSVAIPTLSRLQDAPERFCRYYLKAIFVIGFFTVPGIMYLIIMSDQVISVILGQQWMEASKIFAVLGITALFQPVLGTIGWVFVATGRTDRMFKWGLITSALIIGSFFAGLPFGAIGVALAYSICICVIVVPSFFYAFKTTPLKVSDAFKTLASPFLATFIAGMVLYLTRSFFPAVFEGIIGLILSFVIMGTIYAVSICIPSRSLQPLIEILDLVKELKAKKSGAADA